MSRILTVQKIAIAIRRNLLLRQLLWVSPKIAMATEYFKKDGRCLVAAMYEYFC